jgi:putative hemolysin
MSKKFIDVEKVIGDKNPVLLRWIPRFLLSYIKRVIREDWLNEVVSKSKHLQGVDFATGILKQFQVDVELIDADRVPKTGGVILAANHPLGGIDGIAMVQAIGQIRPDIRFLVNDVLMSIENFQPIFVPVNKFGKNSQQAASLIEEAYSKGFAVLIFPAGLVSRKFKNGIRDLIWKKSFIAKAKKYKKDIIPCFISGKNSNFFYNLAYWRKKIGIKANIEMFFLVDEMYQQRGQKVKIHIGNPVSYLELGDGKSELEWADHIKNIVYEIGASNE